MIKNNDKEEKIIVDTLGQEKETDNNENIDKKENELINKLSKENKELTDKITMILDEQTSIKEKLNKMLENNEKKTPEKVWNAKLGKFIIKDW